jgi:hypothetical protein
MTTPTFNRTIESIKNPKDSQDRRQDLIKKIQDMTGRRLLVYVADVNKPDSILKPEDKTGFSDLIENIGDDQADFLINSPGGFAEVTEAIVCMIRAKFQNIRFVVPNMAKSAGTLLALSANELLMDHRSELGPVDPQVEYQSSDGRRREAAEDILDGFEEAKQVLGSQGPAFTPAFVPLLSKYTIGLLRACENAKKLSKQLAEAWLAKYMFGDEPNSQEPKTIGEYFARRANTLSHNRAIGIDKCLDLKMKVVDLRLPEHSSLAQRIWELWCTYELHFERTPVHKIYENSSGCTLQKQSVAFQIVPVPGQRPVPTPRPQP